MEKKNRTRITVYILLTLYFLVIILATLIDDSNLGGVGLFGFVIGIFLFIVGVIISISEKLRDIGKGLMIGSLIIGLVGFSLCTMNFKI